MSKLTARQQMDNLADFLVEDILEMSDEEVTGELIAEGLDPEKVADEMRAIFEKVMARIDAGENPRGEGERR